MIHLLYFKPLFFKYSLHKIGLLRQIFEAVEHFSLSFTVVVFVSYFDNNLKNGEKYNINTIKCTPDLIS